MLRIYLIVQKVFLFPALTALVDPRYPCRGSTITLRQPQSVGLLWTHDRPVAGSSFPTSHNTQKRQTSMPLAGLEPTILGSEWPQTHALVRAATGIGITKD